MTTAPTRPVRPLRVEVDPATGRLTLPPDEAVRLALALNHLAAVVHWSPDAHFFDQSVADEAAWMAEILGDWVRTGR